jgi:CubicO group peptidase (beta-lactamase class C family)
MKFNIVPMCLRFKHNRYLPSFKNKLLLTVIFCCLTTFCVAQIKSLNGKEISAETMDAFLKKEMAHGSIPGLSIAFINKGKVVYSREMGFVDIEKQKNVDHQTLFEAASLTKSVFAYYVMQQVEKGLIALDTPLYKYMPYPDIEYDERYKLITARLVLSHQTGFPNWRNEGNMPDSLLNKIKYGTLYLKFRPGTQIGYSGEGFQYLAKTIAHLLNTNLKGLGEIMNKEICAALDMTNSTLIRNDYVDEHRALEYVRRDDGTNGKNRLEPFDELDAAGSLRTNAPEFTKFMIALMNKKGLKKQSFNEMFKDQVYYGSSHNSALGLGVLIYHTSAGDRISHNGNNGGFRADYVLYPDKKSGFVFFINNDQEPHLMDHLDYFFKHGEEYPTKDANIPVDVNSYVGEYKSSHPTTPNFVFYAEKGKLFLYVKDDPSKKYEMHPAAKDDFFIKEVIAKLVFSRDKKGIVIGFEKEIKSNDSTKFQKIN